MSARACEVVHSPPAAAAAVISTSFADLVAFSAVHSLQAATWAAWSAPALTFPYHTPLPDLPTPAGVYLGCMYQEYSQLLGEAGAKLSAAAATGNSLSFLVGRVSYSFGLSGGFAFQL